MLFKNSEVVFKYIPILLAVFGGVIGILIYYSNPEILANVDNIWIAFGVGASSGVSATGTNQIIKQLFSNEKNNE